MKDETQQGIEALVLSDNEGGYYAIPRDTLNGYKLTPEQLDKLEEASGGDVKGYLMNDWYVREKITAQYQAERREEAARQRQLRASNAGPDEGEGEPAALPVMPGRGMLTAIFASLRSLTPGVTK
jgi:hypothetical protein